MEKRGKSEPEALATVSKEEAFSPRRRKGRKGSQEWTPAYARVTKAQGK